MLHFLSGVSFYQYLEHIPVPYVGMEKCNSTEHYNGLLDDSHICSGARADKPSCKVRNLTILKVYYKSSHTYHKQARPPRRVDRRCSQKRAKIQTATFPAIL